MNIELLLKIKAAILAEPALYEQINWITQKDCGTAACIAGHACAINNKRLFETNLITKPLGGFVYEDGIELLKINYKQASELFMDWDEPYKTRYKTASRNGNQREKARI
jgi:hypothetical protein